MQERKVLHDDAMAGQSRSPLRRSATGLPISEAQSEPFRLELELPRAG
jgi:hypothetical protein